MSLRQATTNNMQILSVFEPSNRQNTSEGYQSGVAQLSCPKFVAALKLSKW